MGDGDIEHGLVPSRPHAPGGGAQRAPLRLQLDPAGQVRLLTMLLLALCVAAVDQCVKVAITTPTWAYHHRSPSWFFASWALCFGVPILAVVPSRTVLVGAALLSGGLLGNVLSASADGLSVPNPLLLGEATGVAFNVADICIVGGNLILMIALIALAIRNRDRIDEWNVALRNAVRHRL
jgi:lipoprotein signal peptidase